MRPQLGEMGSLSGGRDSALNTKLLARQKRRDEIGGFQNLADAEN